MRLVIVSILILQSIIYSADMAQVFKNDIPNGFISDKNKRAIVERDIAKKAFLNPDILYYYFSYLAMVENGSSLDSMKMYRAHMRSMENIASHSFMDWLGKEIDSIHDSPADEVIKKKVIKIYKKRRLKNIEALRPPPVPPSADNNKVNFFALKYYQKDQEMKYDQGVDYTAARKKWESENHSELVESITEILTLKNPPQSLRLLAPFQYWPLIANPIHLQKISLADAYLMAYEKKLRIKKRTQYAVGLTYHFKNSISQIDYSISHAAPDSFDISKNFLQTIATGKLIGVQVSRQYFLKPYLEHFSYLRVKLEILQGTAEKPVDDKSIFYRKGEPGSDHYEKATFTHSIVEIDEMLSINLDVLTPILPVYNQLYVEFGLGLGYKKISYSHYYQFYWHLKEYYYKTTFFGRTRLSRDWRYISPYFHNSAISQTFFIFPIVNFGYVTPLKGNSVEFSLSSNHISIGLVQNLWF